MKYFFIISHLWKFNAHSTNLLRTCLLQIQDSHAPEVTKQSFIYQKHFDINCTSKIFQQNYQSLLFYFTQNTHTEDSLLSTRLKKALFWIEKGHLLFPQFKKGNFYSKSGNLKSIQKFNSIQLIFFYKELKTIFFPFISKRFPFVLRIRTYITQNIKEIQYFYQWYNSAVFIFFFLIYQLHLYDMNVTQV